MSDGAADSWPLPGEEVVDSGKALGWLPAGPSRILSYNINY